MDSGELTDRCRLLLDGGLPDHIPSRLADEHDVLPLGLDIESDVAVVAVLCWWFGPPGRPSGRSGPPLRRPLPLIDVHRFCWWEGEWASLGGGGGAAPEYPLANRGPGTDLGEYVVVKGNGSRFASPLSRSQERHVSHANLRASSEVHHLTVGSRKLVVPFHGNVFVVWSAERAPTVTVSAADGTQLATVDLSSSLPPA